MLSPQDDLSPRIVKRAARGVVIHVTALHSVDTFVGRQLSVIASVANLLGARPVLVGIRPAVALPLLQLGIELDDITKARNLDAVLRELGARRTRGPARR